MSVPGEVPGRMVRMDYGTTATAKPSPLPAGYDVRPFQRTDWHRCVELMLASPDPHYTKGPWDRALCESSLEFSADEHWDYPGGRGQIIFQGETAVAMALAGGTGYLNQVYTLPEQRRLGLAAAAVTRVLLALHAQGINRCFLLVYQENGVAIRCYEKLGFTVVNPSARS